MLLTNFCLPMSASGEVGGGGGRRCIKWLFKGFRTVGEGGGEKSLEPFIGVDGKLYEELRENIVDEIHGILRLLSLLLVEDEGWGREW
jgi:hypothetical protein